MDAVKIPCDCKAKPAEFMSLCNVVVGQQGERVCIPATGLPNTLNGSAIADVVQQSITIIRSFAIA